MPKFELELPDATVQNLSHAAQEQGITTDALLLAIVQAYANKTERKADTTRVVEDCLARLRQMDPGNVFTIPTLFNKADWTKMSAGYKTALVNRLLKHEDFIYFAGFERRTDEGRDCYRRLHNFK